MLLRLTRWTSLRPCKPRPQKHAVDRTSGYASSLRRTELWRSILLESWRRSSLSGPLRCRVSWTGLQKPILCKSYFHCQLLTPLTLRRQGVGILCAVDRKLLDIEETDQDFLTTTLRKIHERLQGLFSRFLDEQIRAIEDTKVKIKKRKGVISFMKTFPHFSVAIENMLPPASEGGDRLEIRKMVNDAYSRINKAMFESLKVIAKESPTVMASQGQGDPEDKEALNYHILLIENMNHYMEEVDARTVGVLELWKSKAQDEYSEHMSLYVDAVIRRPLGKLLVSTLNT